MTNPANGWNHPANPDADAPESCTPASCTPSHRGPPPSGPPRCWRRFRHALRLLILLVVLPGLLVYGLTCLVLGVSVLEESVGQERSVEAALPVAEGEFEGEIRALEQRDREMPPQPGGVLFVGSSTIRDWDLAKSFPRLQPRNCGFGGSQIEDAVRYMDRIVLPSRPSVVVFYGGDNDLNKGKTPEQVVAQFELFADRLLRELPTARLVVLSIKPSPARWALYPRAREVNDRLRAYCESDPRCQFVEVGSMLLDRNGQPDAAWYKGDGLHVNEAAYARWAEELTRSAAIPTAQE
jgi:lysophospholipase L1-like esterase